MFPYDLLALCLLFLFFSAFFSGSETGILSCSFLKAKNNGLQGDTRSQMLSRLLRQKQSVLVAVLVGTNLSNTMYSLCGESVLQALNITDKFPQSIAFLGSTLILTPVLVVSAEIFPKALFRHYSYTLTKAVTPTIQFFRTVLTPLVFPLTWLTQKFMGAESSLIQYSKQSLNLLVESGTESGSLMEQQETLSRHILSLSNTQMASFAILCPKTHRISIHSKPKEVLQALHHLRGMKSYKEPFFVWDRNKVVGILPIDALYRMSPKEQVRSCMQPVPSSSPEQTANKVLPELMRSPAQIMVVNSDTHTLGYVTLKSLLFSRENNKG